MKRLLAYLFIVLGLGLTFNSSVEAKVYYCENKAVNKNSLDKELDLVFKTFRIQFDDPDLLNKFLVIDDIVEHFYKEFRVKNKKLTDCGKNEFKTYNFISKKNFEEKRNSFATIVLNKYNSNDKIHKEEVAKKKPTIKSKKKTVKTSSKKKNSSNKLPICMNPLAGAKSWYFIKEDGYCYKTLEIKLTNKNSLYDSYYKNIYNKKVYEGKIKVAKEDSVLDKLKSGAEKIINDISGDTQKKKIVKIVKPKIKIKNKQKKIITKPKSQFEQKVLAALELEKVNKVNCIVVEKSNLFTGAKANFCIKKSDIVKLGEFNDFEKFPVNMRKAAKGCKTGNCIRKAAGKNVYKLFVQKKERYHSKHPGDIIYGMAWFELLYLDSLKKAQKALKRYNNNKMNALTKSKDMKTIYSLIKMNNGRIKMREALGLSLYDDLELVLKNHWLLGDFLNNDTLAVEKVALDPELKKRKLLLDKYKTTLSKYKKKLEEKNNNS
jgi:hypothetical protein